MDGRLIYFDDDDNQAWEGEDETSETMDRPQLDRPSDWDLDEFLPNPDEDPDESD